MALRRLVRAAAAAPTRLAPSPGTPARALSAWHAGGLAATRAAPCLLPAARAALARLGTPAVQARPGRVQSRNMASTTASTTSPPADEIAAQIQLEKDANGGEYFYEFADGERLKIEFEFVPIDGVPTAVLYHTYTPENQRGHGYAGVIARHVFDRLLADGQKAVPKCSYLAKFVEKHPEYAPAVAHLPH
eukprot:m.80991 g.80991  ORF g.80991 m.80991 type:complete len:190 (-) comp8215_c0_seq1:140-709(-)